MRSIYLGCGVIFYSLPVGAVENNHPIHQMDTVIMTATAKKEKVHDVIASADVIHGKSLRQRYVNDLSDALNDRVGIDTIGIGLNRKGISIRGMSTEHTLFLVDGQRINSSSSAIKHSDAELNWVPVEAIEQIEVVRGPLSSLYGSEALGGIVNVITRKPTQKWMSSFSTQGMLNESDLGGDQYKSSVYLSGPLIENNLGINFWGEYRHNDDQQNPFNPQLTDQEWQKNHKAHLGLFWQPTDQQHVDFIVEHGIEDRKDWRGDKNKYYLVSDEIKRQRYGVKHQGDWDWGTSTVQVYHTELDRDSTRSDQLGSTPTKLIDQVASSQFQFHTGAHSWTLGNELRREELEDLTVNKKHKARLNHYGIFLQDQWDINEISKIIVGTRGDFHENFGWELSPKISGMLKLNEQFSLRGGVSKGFKAPSLKQLSAEYESNAAMGGRGIIHGNPDLKPETNLAHEVGVHFHQGGFETSLTWFKNDVEDLIDTVRRANCNVKGKICLDYVNIAEAEIQGLEWSATYQIEPSWHFETNYTYLDTKNKITNQALEGRSRHQFNNILTWQATDQLQAKIRQQYRSQQSQGKDSPVDPSYTLWHVYADYQVNPNWSVNAGIENIGDKHLAREESGSFSFSDAGRRYLVGLNVRF